MSHRTSKTQRGFSLIEVVVALAIVALTLGIVLQLLTGTINSVGKADNYLHALSAAQSQLAEIAARPQLQLGTSQGSVEGIDWRTSVRAFPGPRPTQKAKLYHVVVLASYRGSDVELETLFIAGSPP